VVLNVISDIKNGDLLLQQAHRFQHKQLRSAGLDHSTGTDATGTDFDTNTTAAARQHPHSLQIRQPSTTGFIVGVADIISSGRSFATDFTNTGHDSISSKIVVWK
jgi:hypothetical protein